MMHFFLYILIVPLFASFKLKAHHFSGKEPFTPKQGFSFETFAGTGTCDLQVTSALFTNR